MNDVIKKAIKLVRKTDEKWTRQCVVTTNPDDISFCPEYELKPMYIYKKWFRRNAPPFLNSIVECIAEEEVQYETHGSVSNNVIYINPVIQQYGLIYTTYVYLHELGHYNTDQILKGPDVPDDSIASWRHEILADKYAFHYVEEIAKQGYI